MQYKFTLSTDSTADLYHDFMAENHIMCVPLTYSVEKGGQINSFTDSFVSLDEYKDFYGQLRQGAYSRTSILNYQSHFNHFTALAKAGATDTVHFTISSGLSPTIEIAERAAADVKQTYPQFNAFLINSLSATVGQGVLVRAALDFRNSGKTASETAAYCNSIKHKMQHFVVVGSLSYLKRGGRLSGASLVIGTMLSVKPVLSFDTQGKLSVLERARGYKKALVNLAAKIKDYPPAEKSYMTIVHTDMQGKAEELKELLKKEGYEPEVQWMGPIIGSHVGPDAVALCYVSNNLRNDKK